eukprot:TRINITY_DN245_c0_g1_i5.p1 TRINITY_DN245_c0_g1~~TRINITY_DN245_c0_g1_i5.p1  ORF type:complete len:266 (-),score=109.53 TRINITY_DN245_c0_g1_i5:191-892(-)
MEELQKFNKDASGRMLTYRVVVKDQQVTAVLYKKGHSVERALFIEHKLPAEGSLVALPNDRVGVLRRIPVGMIVSTNPSGVEKNPSTYPRAPICTRKHPTELDGFVDVDVVLDGDEKVYPAVQEALPVCRIKLATEEQQAAVNRGHQVWHQNKSDEFLQTLAQLERIVNSPVVLGEDGQPQVSMKDVEELKNQIVAMQALPELANVVDANRIRRVFASIRAYAMELRNAVNRS